MRGLGDEGLLGEVVIALQDKVGRFLGSYHGLFSECLCV
jgi:hypothetical protein